MDVVGVFYQVVYIVNKSMILQILNISYLNQNHQNITFLFI
ncbi:unnamed protein product [Paramecium primaurelia]|uniref:Uncharacterized protein n=1 Tax=Paramecium primaurelia TaxID=5886 RepID=A0A8S1KKY7_PARPR|nr:unnamed protein product [Paramecium primaurelia]